MNEAWGSFLALFAPLAVSASVVSTEDNVLLTHRVSSAAFNLVSIFSQPPYQPYLVSLRSLRSQRLSHDDTPPPLPCVAPLSAPISPRPPSLSRCDLTWAGRGTPFVAPTGACVNGMTSAVRLASVDGAREGRTRQDTSRASGRARLVQTRWRDVSLVVHNINIVLL